MVEYEKDLIPIVRLIFFFCYTMSVTQYRVAIFVGLRVIEIHLLLRPLPLRHHTDQANLPGEKTKLPQHLLHQHLLQWNRRRLLPHPQLLLCCPAELAWWPQTRGGARWVRTMVHLLLCPRQLPGFHQYWHDLHTVIWRLEGINYLGDYLLYTYLFWI